MTQFVPSCTSLVCALLPLTAAAQVVVPITNPSFESPLVDSATAGTAIPGWTGTFNTGVWNVADPRGYWSSPAPNGGQVGYAFAPGAEAVGAVEVLTQPLGVNLEATALYQVTGFAGQPLGIGGPYRVALYAGATLLAEVVDEAPVGGFEPFLLEFNSTDSAAVGLPLSIVLGGAQAPDARVFGYSGYDALSLAVTAVPEPAAMSLLAGFAALSCGAWSRRLGRQPGCPRKRT